MYRTWQGTLRKYMKDQNRQRISKKERDIFRHAYILGYCAAMDCKQFEAGKE